jgi:hypothetical protein
VKQILHRIRSLRSGNGDVFFVSLARVFVATAVVPWNHNPILIKGIEQDSATVKTVQAAGGGVTSLK